MKKLRFFDSLKLVVAVVAATLILNVAHAATLPAGYTELEYIQSTGTQRINTGITGNVVIDTEAQQTHYTGSSQVLAVTTTNGVGGTYFGTTETQEYWGFSRGGSGMSNVLATTKAKIQITFNNSGASGTVNGENIARSASVTQGTLYIFASSSGQFGGYFKLWSMRVYQNGNLVRNFIPARHDADNGKLGLYDTVSGEFFTNAGTGNFIAGEWQIKIATTKYNEESFAPVKTDLSAAVNAVEYVVSNTMSQAQQIDQIANEKQTRPDEGCDAKYCLLVEDEDGTPHWYPIAGANGVAHALPAGYTELQYIESDGRSRIIVPYRVNNKTVFYARYSLATSQTVGIIFGITDAVSANVANNGILRMVGNYNRMGWGNNVSGSVIDVNAPQNLDTWYEVLYDQNKLYQDNVLYATSATSNDTEWVANYDLGIFARNGPAGNFYPAIAKISSVWAKENGEYKINLVPAKNSSGVVGMYDLVSGQFFTNAWTGEFTAGPDM